MNYFELYGLPVSFYPPRDEVRRRYFELSKQRHPDYFAGATGGEQDAALEQTAEINKGYKTLSSPDATLRYVLQQKGLLGDEEKFSLPPDFLMEMMEINEEVDELKTNPDPARRQQVIQQLQEFEDSLLEPVAPLLKSYNESNAANLDLEPVKEYYFKKKYLGRIYTALNSLL